MRKIFIPIFVAVLFLGIFGLGNLAEAQTICDMTFTDADGETHSADGWCTWLTGWNTHCTSDNCDDDIYDFCVDNTHYRFGCKCASFPGVGCDCDPDKAQSEECAGGCTNWDCGEEGCSGGECNTTPPPICTPNGCNGNCPPNCTVAEDPDCPPCTGGNGCCGIGCTDSEDNDCTPGCPPGQIKPYKKCVDTTTCQSIDSCGVNVCVTNTDCAAPLPTCGNGFCDPGETAANCPADCGGGGGDGGIIKIESPINATSFEALVGGIVNFLFYIALVLAPLMIIIGAIYLLTSGGDPKKLETGKNIIIYTLIGLAIILLAKGLIAVLKTIIGVK